MSRPAAVAWPVVAVTLVAASVQPAGSQGGQVHGENSVFVGHGVVIAWGVLRGATEEATHVAVRVVVPGGAYSHLDIQMVDPFTQARRPVGEGLVPLGPGVTTYMTRAGFADFPRREFRFWQAGRPALVVYYLGVPDTTPEFVAEAALQAYLKEAAAKAGGAGEGGR